MGQDERRERNSEMALVAFFAVWALALVAVIDGGLLWFSYHMQNGYLMNGIGVLLGALVGAIGYAKVPGIPMSKRGWCFVGILFLLWLPSFSPANPDWADRSVNLGLAIFLGAAASYQSLCWHARRNPAAIRLARALAKLPDVRDDGDNADRQS